MEEDGDNDNVELPLDLLIEQVLPYCPLLRDCVFGGLNRAAHDRVAALTKNEDDTPNSLRRWLFPSIWYKKGYSGAAVSKWHGKECVNLAAEHPDMMEFWVGVICRDDVAVLSQIFTTAVPSVEVSLQCISRAANKCITYLFQKPKLRLLHKPALLQCVQRAIQTQNGHALALLRKADKRLNPKRLGQAGEHQLYLSAFRSDDSLVLGWIHSLWYISIREEADVWIERCAALGYFNSVIWILDTFADEDSDRMWKIVKKLSKTYSPLLRWLMKDSAGNSKVRHLRKLFDSVSSDQE